jgi:hypothetical protein
MSSSKPSGPRVSEHWSDGETSALLDAWGQMYLSRNRVRDNEWHQVCSAVNTHRAAAGRRFDRSIAQCQWRLYTLKGQYKKELAKGQPTSGWRHFAQLRAILDRPNDAPPPGFAAKMTIKEEEEEEEKEVEEKTEASGGASGSVRRRTVPAKRHFSSLHDSLDLDRPRSGGPTPGLPPRMSATAKKEKEEVEEEKVGGEEGAHGSASAGSLPGEVVTKLSEVSTKLAEVSVKLVEVYERVEMERLSVEKEAMAMERERRTTKVAAENLGETDDN